MDYTKYDKPEVGRGVAFGINEAGEPCAKEARGCFRLHEEPWLAEYPDNFPTDIFEVRFKNTRRSFYQNVNNLQLEVGDIMAARILTWGLPGINPLANVGTRTDAEPLVQVHAGIGLTLRNGNVYSIEKDITDQMRKRPSGGVITIVVDATELPENVVGEKPKPGGGFDASVENWENEIEEEIII